MSDLQDSPTDDPWWPVPQGEEWVDIDLPDGTVFRVYQHEQWYYKSSLESLAPSRLFRYLIWPCHSYCWRVAYRIVRNQDAAEDVAQVALSRAFFVLQRLTCSDLRTLRVYPWLYRIVSNAALDYMRAQSKRFSVEDPDSWLYRKEASSYDNPVQAVLYAEDSKDLELLLDMLPKSYRRVIEDVVLRDSPYEEVAGDYNMNVIAVRTRYHRAVRRLAEIVRQERLNESDLRRWLERYEFVRTRDQLSSTTKHTVKGANT